MVQAPDVVVGAANFTKGELKRAGCLPYEQQHIQGAWKAALWIWKENSANVEICGARRQALPWCTYMQANSTEQAPRLSDVSRNASKKPCWSSRIAFDGGVLAF
jgi:hypothetical protein